VTDGEVRKWTNEDDDTRNTIEKIINHRKIKGQPPELLVLWQEGSLEWSILRNVKKDEPKLTVDYIQEKKRYTGGDSIPSSY
jgi:hypothetical protein